MYKNRYRNRRRSSRRNDRTEYLTPFFILIALLVATVLLINLWGRISSSESNADATVHFYYGSGELKVWGTDDFFDVEKSTLLKQGDEISLYPDSKAIVEFFDGSLLRIDGGAQLSFEVMRDSDERVIEVNLIKGDVWANRAYKSEIAKETEFKVNLGELEVSALEASILAVEKDEEEVNVRVFKSFESGKGAEVSVFSGDLKTVVDTETVGVAQEFTVNDSVLDAYRGFMSPTVLSGIDNDFEDSEWYAWNVEEDQSPKVFEDTVLDTDDIGLVSVEAEIEEDLVSAVEASEADVVGNEELEEEEVQEPEEGIELGDLESPKVINVSGGTIVNDDGFYVVRNNPAVLKGSVSGASSVVVNGYTLQKFSAGDSEWVYYANADFDLMKEGENVFEVYAVGENGLKSEVTTIKVLYEVAQPVVEEDLDVVEGAEEETIEEVEDQSAEDAPNDTEA